MDWTWFPLSPEETKRYAELCPIGEYRVLSSSVDFSPIPSDLVKKCDSVFFAASGDPSGNAVYYMANLNRVDEKAGAIDQQPFGFIVDSRSAFPSGCLVHHGDWKDRTSYPSKEFWKAITQSSTGICYQTNQLPSLSAGKIADITIASQREAFSVVIEKLQSEFDRFIRNKNP